jgi:hypothetical protein
MRFPWKGMRLLNFGPRAKGPLSCEIDLGFSMPFVGYFE